MIIPVSQMILFTFEKYLKNISKKENKKEYILSLINDFNIPRNIENLKSFFQELLFNDNYRDLYQLFLFEVVMRDKEIDEEYLELLTKLNYIFLTKGYPRINSNHTFDIFVYKWISSDVDDRIKYPFLKLWFSKSGLCQWIRKNPDDNIYGNHILDLISFNNLSDTKKDFILYCIRNYKRYEEEFLLPSPKRFHRRDKSCKNSLIFQLVEIITNPNRRSDQDWYIFSRGAFDLDRLSKIIYFLLTEKEFVSKNLPQNLVDFYCFQPFEKDENGNTIFHYIFISLECILEKDEICCFDLPQILAQKIMLARLRLKEQVFDLFYKNYPNLPFIQINNEEKNPFGLMYDHQREWFQNLVDKAILTKDQYLLSNCLSAIPEFRSILNTKSLEKVDKFLNYVQTRNTLLFGKVKNKAIPLIPNDVYKYIVDKF